jgi:ribulose-phosphate 3-epimerase
MENKRKIIAPSVLSADFSDMRQVMDLLNRSKAEWVHWDVMDGHFVPNITFGPDFIKRNRKRSDKFFDVHLMIENPGNYISDFAGAGADLITVHWEAERHLHRVADQIRKAGCRVGVALNPATPVACLEDIVKELDLVLIMSVNPGFGGQKFIEHSYDKIRKAKELLLSKNSSALLEVDGGVNASNAAALFEAGADVLVAGSFVFGHNNPLEAIASLQNSGGS